MKCRQRFLLLAALLTAAPVLYGRVLSGHNFSTSGDWPSGWQLKSLGDGSGKHWNAIVPGQSHGPLLLTMPSMKSWQFLVFDLPAAQLQGVTRLRLTARVLANRTCMAVVLAESGTWGELVTRQSGANNRTTLQWETVTAELTRSAPDQMISAAIGIDYNYEGAWAMVDQIVLEADYDPAPPRLAAAPVDPRLPPEALAPELAEQLGRLVPAEIPADLPEQEAAALAARNARLRDIVERFSGKNGVALAEVAHMAEADALLRQEDYLWQVADTLAVVNADTPLLPYNTMELAVAMPQRGQDARILLLRNNTLRPLGFEVKVTGDAAALVTPALLRLVDDVPDCPVPLGSIPVVEVGRNQTAALELTFATADAAPGTYTGQLTIAPADGKLECRAIDLAVTVYPVELPEQMPIRVYNWDYGSTGNPSMLELFAESRVNVFSIPFFDTVVPADLTRIHELVPRLRERFGEGGFEVVIEVWFVGEAGGWKPEFNAWLDRLVAALEAEGLTYDNWYLHIYDERLHQEFLDSAKAIQAYNPRVRIFSDMLDRDPEVVKAFAPYLAVWCPFASHMTSALFEESRNLIRGGSLPVWVYQCDAMPKQAPSTYRLLPWQAWRWGVDGCSFWTARTVEFRTETGKPNFGINYLDTEDRVVAGRRWKMWRAGLEDYLLLEMAAELAERKGDMGLRAHIDALVDRVLTAPTHQGRAIEGARRELLELLKK